MSIFAHPAFIGALIVGICFNILFGILGLLGFALLDALWIAAALLTIVASALVQHMIQSGKGEG
jgi:hypothetical protein